MDMSLDVYQKCVQVLNQEVAVKPAQKIASDWRSIVDSLVQFEKRSVTQDYQQISQQENKTKLASKVFKIKKLNSNST